MKNNAKERFEELWKEHPLPSGCDKKLEKLLGQHAKEIHKSTAKLYFAMGANHMITYFEQSEESAQIAMMKASQTFHKELYEQGDRK